VPTQGQLLRARHRFAGMLPDLATIQRETSVPDGGGGQTTTWPDIATDVPCRLGPLGGGEQARKAAAVGDRITDEATAVVTFEAGTDVTVADRVVIGGRVFDVTLVKPRGAWELTKRCEVKEL
jgi:head-tail adaptor